MLTIPLPTFSILSLQMMLVFGAHATARLPAEESPQDATSSPSTTQPDVRSATVVGLDGTKIDLLVASDGKALTVAIQDPSQIHRKKKKKHNVVEGNPVDEPLVAGLMNDPSLTLIEDAQPQVSNPIP
jgi:hypothetical protein